MCLHFVELKWAYGCPFDCSWCYLKGTFRFRPEGIKPIVIVSFTLNALPVSEWWEKKAPSVANRIEAAKKLVKAGYEVRTRIDPMVPVENWQKIYKKLIDRIFLEFKPERITFGSLRGLQSTINGTKDTSWVHYLKETSNWGKKIDFTSRLKMYSEIIGYLERKYEYRNIALCKETIAMWNKLGMNYKKLDATVYGNGVRS